MRGVGGRCKSQLLSTALVLDFRVLQCGEKGGGGVGVCTMRRERAAVHTTMPLSQTQLFRDKMLTVSSIGFCAVGVN
eukprot:m.484416 g.484416  ORF g.484416 m.484416 type:complete len:77 (-) comp68766_c0_seq1:12-242(-)